MMNPIARGTGRLDMEQCPQLKATLIYCCIAQEQAFVLLPFMLDEFCKNGSFRKCPFRTRSVIGEVVIRERRSAGGLHERRNAAIMAASHTD